METNKLFVILGAILIIIITIVAIVLFVLYRKKDKTETTITPRKLDSNFTPSDFYSETELEKMFPVSGTSGEKYTSLGSETELKNSREKLQKLFIEKANKSAQKFVSEDIKEYLKFCFDKKVKLRTIISDKLSCDGDVDNNKFDTSFENFIQNYEIETLVKRFARHERSFIKNMDNVVKETTKVISENCTKTPTVFTPDASKSFDDILQLVFVNMGQYQYYAADIASTTSFSENFINAANLSDEKVFKEFLILLLQKAAYLFRNMANKTDFKNAPETIIFNTGFSKIYNFYTDSKNKSLLEGYDRTLLSVYFTTALSFNLLIVYWSDRTTVENQRITEILKNIPKSIFSEGIDVNDIKRSSSEISALGVNYIITELFKNKDDISNFHKILEAITKNPVYENNILIRYNKADKPENKEGLYYDNGFIASDDLVSYSYLLDHAFPSLFFDNVCKFETKENINKIFAAFSDIVFRKRRVNPAIASRYGRFDEITSYLDKIIDALKATNFKFEDNSVKHVKKYNDKVSIQPASGIVTIPSARIILTNQEKWSFQHKINSDLLYAEVKPYNNGIIKNMLMGKIMFVDLDSESVTSAENSGYQTHSFYPGVLSYASKSEIQEVVAVTNEKPKFETTDYTNIVLDNDSAVVYTKVKATEFNIEYEEMVLITKFGIYVGYFNIVKDSTLGTLSLTVSSELIESLVGYKILYKDNEKEETDGSKAKSKIIEVGKHVLYCNYMKESGSELNNNTAVVETDEKIIKITIEADKKYEIELRTESGLFAKIAS